MGLRRTSSRTSYERYGRVLFLGHDGRSARDHGREPVVKRRVRRDGQHGSLLPRGLFADRPDPVEADRPKHQPNDRVHRTPHVTKNAIEKKKKAQHHHTLCT